MQRTTPRTGNCQYYAIAMAILSQNFNGTASIEALENLTAKLKTGIVAAANHFFDQEFPHEQRANELVGLAIREEEATSDNPPKFTAQQSEQHFREHLAQLGKSNSKLDSTLPTRYWGTSTTLRMAAKILQRSIFVVLARNGWDNASYEIFEPTEVKMGGGVTWCHQRKSAIFQWANQNSGSKRFKNIARLRLQQERTRLYCCMQEGTISGFNS
ncbi:hypothetical protein PHMEG_0007684 [Phytophthora megakarya]|uniref:OTU domain-containing protein n=1 Tax=Phytophthora megakarya TaxID=4795 RepID=A0A225WMN9_9STRA|nr:hypothetical protein PHMEG_0007684 [Phytophthora megakarya]